MSLQNVCDDVATLAPPPLHFSHDKLGKIFVFYSKSKVSLISCKPSWLPTYKYATLGPGSMVTKPHVGQLRKQGSSVRNGRLSSPKHPDELWVPSCNPTDDSNIQNTKFVSCNEKSTVARLSW